MKTTDFMEILENLIEASEKFVCHDYRENGYEDLPKDLIVVCGKNINEVFNVTIDKVTEYEND